MIRALGRHFEEIAGSLLLAGMCGVALGQVAGRYLLASPPAWTEELATLLFAWLVFVGASLALKRNEHFALEVLVDRLPQAPRRVVQTVGLGLVLAFSALLVGYGIDLAAGAWNVKTSTLEIPRTWLYASVPFGGALMGIRTIERLVWLWRAAPTTEDADREEPAA